MDCFTIWEKDVEEITAAGIHYLGGFLDFSACRPREKDAAIGEYSLRDTPVCLVFFTEPIATRIAFEAGSKWKALLTHQPPASKRLLNMKEKIEGFGFPLREKK